MIMEHITLFEHVNGFTDADSAAVQAISPILVSMAPQLTDKFYAQLTSHPKTNKHIEGVSTHSRPHTSSG